MCQLHEITFDIHIEYAFRLSSLYTVKQKWALMLHDVVRFNYIKSHLIFTSNTLFINFIFKNELNSLLLKLWQITLLLKY
jgi:hypothetical protein